MNLRALSRAPSRFSPLQVPLEPVELDLTHPAALGIERYLFFGAGSCVDLVDRSGPVLANGAIIQAAGALGPGATFSSSNVALPAELNPQVYTFETLIEMPATTINCGIFGYNANAATSSGSNDRELQIYGTGSGSQLQYYTYNGGGDTVIGPYLAPNTVYHIAITSTGSEQTLYVDGVSVATGAYAGGYSGFTTVFWCVGQAAGSTPPAMSGVFTGILHYAAQRNVALTAGQVARLAAKPFEPLRPKYTPRRGTIISVSQSLGFVLQVGAPLFAATAAQAQAAAATLAAAAPRMAAGAAQAQPLAATLATAPAFGASAQQVQPAAATLAVAAPDARFAATPRQALVASLAGGAPILLAAAAQAQPLAVALAAAPAAMFAAAQAQPIAVTLTSSPIAAFAAGAVVQPIVPAPPAVFVPSVERLLTLPAQFRVVALAPLPRVLTLPAQVRTITLSRFA